MTIINHQNVAYRGNHLMHNAGFIVAFFLSLIISFSANAADLPETAMAKIGPGVLETLKDAGSVHVMIALQRSQEYSHTDESTGLDKAAVRKRIGQLQRDLLAQLAYSDYEVKHTYSAVPAMAGRIKSEEGLSTIALNPGVIMIDIDVGGVGHLAESVPLIAADLRHAVGNTGDGVVVAVIDSGLDTDHVNLSDDLIAEACFGDNDGSIDGVGLCPNGSDRQTGPGAAEDDAGHGSHVSGIITSNGTLGSVGVAPDAEIVSIKMTFGPTFSGTFSFYSELVAALDYIINNPQLNVQVINMSLGTNALFSGDCDASTAYNMAGAASIDLLRANGVTSFASAANDSSTTQMSSPACLSNVISVGASDDADNTAAFTNSNAQTDIFAPGVDVVSSTLANGIISASGTSMASPTAAGCAALLIEAGDAVTPNEIEATLESSPFFVTVAGSGLTFPRVDCSSFFTPAKPKAVPTLPQWALITLSMLFIMMVFIYRRRLFKRGRL